MRTMTRLAPLAAVLTIALITLTAATAAAQKWSKKFSSEASPGSSHPVYPCKMPFGKIVNKRAGTAKTWRRTVHFNVPPNAVYQLMVGCDAVETAMPSGPAPTGSVDPNSLAKATYIIVDPPTLYSGAGGDLRPAGGFAHLRVTFFGDRSEVGHPGRLPHGGPQTEEGGDVSAVPEVI